MHKMHKKATAMLLAMSMVMSPAVAAMAEEAVTESSVAEDVTTVGDDAEIKEVLEEKAADVTDENGSFDADKMKEFIASLFGPNEGEGLPDLGKEIEEGIADLGKGIEEGLAAIEQIEDAVNEHLTDEFADSLGKGDETVFSNTIADLDYHDDEDKIHILGYFSLTNFDVDKDSPEDLVMKNSAGQPELLELTRNQDGVFEVSNFVAAEDGEGYADSCAAMCEDIELDLDKFYEAMALTDLSYLAELYNFMEEHKQYNRIEYMGELKTLDDLGKAMNDEFVSYLKLFAVEVGLIDADELEAEEEKVNFRAFVETIVTEIEKAAAEVDLKAKEAETGKEYSEEGTIFTLLKDILTDLEKRTEQKNDALKKVLEGLSSLADAEEGELDDILSLGLLGIISGEVDEKLDEGTGIEDIEIANLVATFVFETAKENKQIAEAVEATDSRLFDMLSNSSAKLKDQINTDGTMNVIEDIPEEPFEKFEAELAKVTDYINAQEGPKQAALDLLDLLHKIVDEIHLSVHGHTHEALE